MRVRGAVGGQSWIRQRSWQYDGDLNNSTHFKSKHKALDTFCARYCNPYLQMDLVCNDGQWVFNSSAAEQTNVWFGSFQAIMRDMQVERFNFFLDEMIMHHYTSQCGELKHQGAAPYNIPCKELLVHM